MFEEPGPPDFERLPPGTKELFERRQVALPIGRIHAKIGGEALMSNEGQVVNRFEREHGLTWEERAPLGTWHMRAVHQRISQQKPDTDHGHDGEDPAFWLTGPSERKTIPLPNDAVPAPEPAFVLDELAAIISLRKPGLRPNPPYGYISKSEQALRHPITSGGRLEPPPGMTSLLEGRMEPVRETLVWTVKSWWGVQGVALTDRMP